MGVGDGSAVLLTAPPPQPAMSRTSENKAAPAKIGRLLLREFLANKLHPANIPQDRANQVPTMSWSGPLLPLIVKLLAAAGAVVVMTRLSLPASILRSIDLGAKLHCAPAGSPLQLNDRTPGSPAIVRANSA